MTASSTSFRGRMISLVLRVLRMPCGAFGGAVPVEQRETPWDGRWCRKSFGHEDSCAFDAGRQPLWRLRRRAKGYRDV